MQDPVGCGLNAQNGPKPVPKQANRAKNGPKLPNGVLNPHFGERRLRLACDCYHKITCKSKREDQSRGSWPQMLMFWCSAKRNSSPWVKTWARFVLKQKQVWLLPGATCRPQGWQVSPLKASRCTTPTLGAHPSYPGCPSLPAGTGRTQQYRAVRVSHRLGP